MLQKYKMRDTDDGWVVLSELEDWPCDRCGGESIPQRCEGDDSVHYHGAVHTVHGGIEAVCGPCGHVVAQEWRDRRKQLATQWSR